MSDTGDVLRFALEHVIAFGFGAALGFVLADRYRITRRNGARKGEE